MFNVRLSDREQLCDTCAYWRVSGLSDCDDGETLGDCLRYPPMPNPDPKQFGLPVLTNADAWCGEYRTDHGLPDGETHVTRELARREADDLKATGRRYDGVEEMVAAVTGDLAFAAEVARLAARQSDRMEGQ